MDKNTILALALTFIAQTVYAGTSALISGFDAFDGAQSNNSSKIGAEAVRTLKNKFPEGEFKYCQLRTVYDKSFETLQDCVAEMASPPNIIISLGETGCGEVKVETRSINMDKDISQDNDGIHRTGTPILPAGPLYSGFKMPLEKLWCGLNRRDRNYARVSNYAGTFVCNNLAYRISEQRPDLPFIFVHVPRSNCGWRPGHHYRRSLRIVLQLAATGMRENLMKSSMPTNRHGVEQRIEGSGSCEKDFFSRLLEAY